MSMIDRQRDATVRRVTAIFYAVPGVGWAVSTLLVLAYLDRRGELPMTPFGFRLLGGPYPRIGIERLTPLGWALAWLLVAVSALDTLVGRWLWQGHRRGAALALALAPVSFALGRLFALPFLIVAVPVRVILVLLSWHELGRRRH
jgi:hypothetical protein